MKLILGRQAILNREQKTVAYELLFRTLDNTPVTSDTDATAQVLANTLSMFGSGSVLGTKKGFVNLGIDILRKDLLGILPPDKFVLEILETQQPTPELVKHIRSLKSRGYAFALDDFILSKEQVEYWTPVLKEVHIVKVDLVDTTEEDLRTHIELLSLFKVQLLAEKVETKEMFDLCMELGFQYFQGYFFTKPVVIEGQGFDPNTQGIMQVVRLIQQDKEINVIEDTIKRYPDLCISVLKLANSASVTPINPITSIRQTIALVGKKALSQWLMLMLYSQHAPEGVSATSNILFILAVQRGKMMEQIIRAGGEKSRNLIDESFLAGLLSLSDTLLHIPIEKILSELSVSKIIEEAILEKKGVIGAALQMVLALETQDVGLIQNLNITPEKANQISIDAYKYSLSLAKSI